MNLKTVSALSLTTWLVLLHINLSAQKITVEPHILDAVVNSFPEARESDGPFELEFNVDIRKDGAGFGINKYTLYSAGKSLGPVSIIQSSFQNPDKPVIHAIVRYDDDGKILTFTPLEKWKIGEREIDLQLLAAIFVNTDIRDYRQSFHTLIDSLATGAKMAKVKAPTRPPKGKPIDLSEKTLKPGEKLPPLKATAIDGQVLDSQKLGGLPHILVFTSPKCEKCLDVLKTIKDLVAMEPFNGKCKVAYIVHGDKEESQTYASDLGLEGLIIPDAQGLLTSLLKIPFKPYTLMVEPSGILKYNVYWTEKEKIAGAIYGLIENK